MRVGLKGASVTAYRVCTAFANNGLHASYTLTTRQLHPVYALCLCYGYLETGEAKEQGV